jgi:hypothetical protein
LKNNTNENDLVSSKITENLSELFGETYSSQLSLYTESTLDEERAVLDLLESNLDKVETALTNGYDIGSICVKKCKNRNVNRVLVYLLRK